MQKIKVWDLFVRLFHWSLVLAITLNLFFLDGEHSYHKWVGYGALAFVVSRFFWGFIGSRYARFSTFPPSIDASLEQVSDVIKGRTKVHKGHTPLGALMIYNIFLTIVVIAGSGYAMTTDMFWGMKMPELIHEIAVDWLQISIVLHVAAVIFESARTRVNLPGAMITGTKIIPETAKVID